MALLAQSRQIATDVTKDCRSRPTAKSARDLLPYFDHAQVALGLIVDTASSCGLRSPPKWLMPLPHGQGL
jgi:hypothetical protein